MIVKRPELLKAFAEAGCCEFCNKWCRVREAHHWRARGSGGAFRMDLRCNLISLGSSPNFQCPCHSMIGDGNISRDAVLEVIAEREGTTMPSIRCVLALVTRLPKDATPEMFNEQMSRLARNEARLAKSVRAEIWPDYYQQRSA